MYKYAYLYLLYMQRKFYAIFTKGICFDHLSIEF